MPLTNVPPAKARPSSGRRYARARGQALVEFALVIPILLTLLLGVADFGRLFAAGIVVQTASRDGAEAAAQEYVQTYDTSSGISYTALHATAQRVACAEAQRLLGSTVDATTGACTVPAIAVCVHDNGINGSTGDPLCGQTIVSPTSAETANCPNVNPAPSNWSTSPDTAGLPYVEVRICYPFSMLMQTQILPIGTTYLQQSSSFVGVIY